MSEPRPDLRLIALDETEYWDLTDDLTPEQAAYFEGIDTVYLYNANEYTYCAELTPSYWLWPVVTQARWDESAWEDGEIVPVLDHIDNLIGGYPADAMYVHVSRINNLADAYKTEHPERIYRYGSLAQRRITDDQFREFAQEVACQCPV